MKIGDFVSIGSNSIVEAASIGNGVEIGKNCVIVSSPSSPSFAGVELTDTSQQGPLTIIKDNARIADNSIVGPGTIIPSLGEWGGSPGRLAMSSAPLFQGY